jgi:hypothetical protein
MKRVVVDQFGGPEVVSVVEDDAPRPGAGEVRVPALRPGSQETVVATAMRKQAAALTASNSAGKATAVSSPFNVR